MGTIHLKNIKIFTNHGCLVEEEKIGSDYVVNLSIGADLKKASLTDALIHTVDYVHLNRIVKEEMEIRSELLEHAAQRIINRIISELKMVQTIQVEVAKINPPIGGDVESVAVILDGSR